MLQFSRCRQAHIRRENRIKLKKRREKSVDPSSRKSPRRAGIPSPAALAEMAPIAPSFPAGPNVVPSPAAPNEVAPRRKRGRPPRLAPAAPKNEVASELDPPQNSVRTRRSLRNLTA